MSGHGSSQGLAEAEDGLRVHASRVYKILKGCISVAVKSGLTWLAFTSAIATVFQGEYICRRVSEEFIDGRTIGNIAGITVEGQKCVFGFLGIHQACSFVPSEEVNQISWTGKVRGRQSPASRPG